VGKMNRGAMGWRWAWLALITLGGCSTEALYVTPLRQSPRPLVARSPERVEIFASGPPRRPYIDLALLEAAEDAGKGAGSGRLIFQLRARAAQQGCDALVLAAPSPRIDAATANLTGVVLDRNALSATCIVYVSEAELALAPRPPSFGPLSKAPAPTIDASRQSRGPALTQRGQNAPEIAGSGARR
jgi:hypothetical protein